MNKLRMNVLLVGTAFCAFSCNSAEEKKEEVVVVASAPSTNATPATVDLSSIAISDKELGNFPYLQIPKDLTLQNPAVERALDLLFFPINGGMQPIEGKIWKANIVAETGKKDAWSSHYFMKSYEDAITELGGVKVFEGKVSTEELDRIKDQATYFGEEGSLDYWNEPVKTYIIRRAKGDDVFIQFAGNSASGKIQIIQKAISK